MAKERSGISHPVDVYIGQRVRMRRLDLRMSQQQLAKALGLTFQQVQKYEKGSNRIGAGRLMHLALLLEVPINYFYDGAPAIVIKGKAATPRKLDANRDVVVDLMQTPNGVRIAKALQRIKSEPKLVRSVVVFLEQVGDGVR